jgi:TetR/AcrR family fatty acid metabolism transcriptional regulator
MTMERAARTKDDVVKEFRTAEIVEAAGRVIAHVGYGGASMERIAREAGLSKGTLYLYFESREDLLARATEHGWGVLMSRVKASCRRARGYDAKVRELVRASVEHSIENGVLIRALVERASPGCARSPALEPPDAAPGSYLAYVTQLMERGIRAGELRPVDPHHAARLLLATVGTVLDERAGNGPAPCTEPQIDAAVDLFLYGAAAGGKP